MIFCPDPDVPNEFHEDHLNVGNICKRLAFSSSNRGIMEEMGLKEAPLLACGFYMTARPSAFVKTKGYLGKQLSALFENHLSQFPEGSGDRKSVDTYLKLRSHMYGLRNFCSSAEGFRVIGKGQMHCLPEISK